MALLVYKSLWAGAVVFIGALIAGIAILSGGWQAVAFGIALMAGGGVLISYLILAVLSESDIEPAPRLRAVPEEPHVAEPIEAPSPERQPSASRPRPIGVGTH